ncbi:MAG TPA: hypothetical protein VHH36_00245 [Candidatus Thermoplasmatota archaeon]|nr:hypothetical protein [Candidatus Thermoplasmatota archaeon]
MKALIALLLATATLAMLPAADAHQCQSGTPSCGDCVKGEMHNHQDPRGQCTSGPGYIADQGWNGQRAEVAGLGVVGAMAALGLGAVALRVRK